VTWDAHSYDLRTGETRQIASDVVDAQMSPNGPHIAFHTPDATLVHDFANGATLAVPEGRDPCLFDLDMGFTCHPSVFTDDGRLLFVAGLDRDALAFHEAYAGTLFRLDLTGKAVAVRLASDVVEYSAHAGGKVAVYASHYAFDSDPDCQCPRADLTAIRVDGSGQRRLLAQARYASSSRHVAVGSDGDTVAFYDPDSNPTEVEFASIDSGAATWIEPDCRLDRPLVLDGGLGAVVKPMWTGARVDNAIEVLSLAEPEERVRVGEEVRRLRVSADGRALAVLEYPYSATFYDGPTRIRLWSLDAAAPEEYARFDFEGSVAFHLAAFDAAAENLLVHLDYHDNWRGRVAVLIGQGGQLRRVSESAEAYAAQWLGPDALAYLEDHAVGVPGAVRTALAPFTSPRETGNSVHLYEVLAGECPSLVYADCASYMPDEELCAGAVPGLYELRL
jgi:hypothetical protein